MEPTARELASGRATSTRRTRILPDDAYYVDVGVRERDQPSLFRKIGLELLRNDARARVELFSAAAGKGFLPIALPDQNIVQAQLRYYRECGLGCTRPAR